MTDATPDEIFVASRWTKGNFLFPIRIVVNSLHVIKVKPRFFGSSEESIAMTQVASVQISTGIIWSTIVLTRRAGRTRSPAMGIARGTRSEFAT